MNINVQNFKLVENDASKTSIVGTATSGTKPKRLYSQIKESAMHPEEGRLPVDQERRNEIFGLLAETEKQEAHDFVLLNEDDIKLGKRKITAQNVATVTPDEIDSRIDELEAQFGL
jgi:hypothetical protein